MWRQWSVQQLEGGWENLRKATAHLFRNLAWKADKNSKAILSSSRVVTVLITATMEVGERNMAVSLGSGCRAWQG